MLLVLDVGNTNIKMGIYNGKSWNSRRGFQPTGLKPRMNTPWNSIRFSVYTMCRSKRLTV